VQGMRINFNCQKLKRSNGFKSREEKHLENFLCFEDLKRSKVKHKKSKFEERTSTED
jgi:hypothetical protein